MKFPRRLLWAANVAVYWAVHFYMSASDARSRRPVSRLCLRMDQYPIRAHFRAGWRQGAAVVAAAWLFRNPCDVAPGRAAARRQIHADHRGPAGLRLVGYATERQGSHALYQARDGAKH